MQPEMPWDVFGVHHSTVVVGPEHVDQFGHTNNVQYLRWLEAIAWSHSQALGLGFEDYQQHGVGCVVRRHELDYLAATFAGEQLDVGTWVHSNDGRLSMWRAYQIIRCSDHKTVLRGKTQWVCVNMNTGRPTRMPAEYVTAYQPPEAVHG